MAPRADIWARSTSRWSVRRGMVIAALVLIVALVVWNVSSQNLGLVALATAPAGALGLLLARDPIGWRVAGEGGSLATGWDSLEREIDRSRRHERPLALATASFPDQDISGEGMAETIARAGSQLRSIDVLWFDGPGLWLLMPESNRDGGTTAIRRINHATPATRGAGWRLVVFPDDAITVRSLMTELARADPVDLVSRPTAPAEP